MLIVPYLYKMNWQPLTEAEQITVLTEESYRQPIIIFKHSTRCSISSMAKQRIDKAGSLNTAVLYYLDLLRYRSLSDAIASRFDIRHESPQILVIRNGTCVFHASHNGIEIETLQPFLI